MRSLDLEVDGPTRWGSLPTTTAAGIFVVEAAAPAPSAPLDLNEIRRWLERVPGLRLDGERPTQATLGRRLGSFWLPSQTLLYVGRSSKSLASRVAALYATELGHRRPHSGGYWLKTLREPSRLRLWWAETAAAEEYEDALISAFAEALPEADRQVLETAVPALPWANLESPDGRVRDTGLSGALLSADATPARTSAARRSDPSAGSRRPAASTASGPRTARRRPGSSGPAGPGPVPRRDQPTHVTAEGLAAMQSELERLTNVERPQVVERIKHARELGDLRENADYEAARNEQSFLEGHIQEIEQRLRTAVVIRSTSRAGIALGSIVRYEVDGQAGELTVVGSTESDPAAGRISAVSPVGRALMGRQAGEEVVVVTPAARMRYRIVAVE